MKTVLSEKELISAIVSRNPVGAAALYDQYAVTLFKLICCSVRNRQEAENVLEKTLLLVWNNINDYHGQDKRLLLWMASIARRQMAGGN